MADLISSPDHIKQLLTSKCRISENGRGMEIASLNSDEWMELVNTFVKSRDKIDFWIYDLLYYGEKNIDRDRYEWAVEATGLSRRAVYQKVSACGKIPPKRRIFDLKFAHYYEVAFNLSEEDQDDLLRQAEQKKWTSSFLRQMANLRKRGAIDISSEILPTVSFSNAGAQFEDYIYQILNLQYPEYAWTRQGKFKRHERGLDFIGNPLASNDQTIFGVQVKLHSENRTPSEEEWLKFLAGCFTRRVTRALFITTGRLTGEQHRDAQETGAVTVIDHDKLKQIAAKHNLKEFVLLINAAEQGAAANP